MWDELWLEKELTVEELTTAVAKAHDIPPDQVELVEGIASRPTSPASVFVHRIRGAGQFPTRIQISGAEPDDRRVFCARLASALACRVLGDDGNIDPCTFMLYEPGNATRVAVDAQSLEEHEPRIVGPYVPTFDEDSHPTTPIRRHPEQQEHRSSRGGQVAGIVNDYMVEGLPRPPLIQWNPDASASYASLQKLLGTLAFRKASDDELANVTKWSELLRTTFPDQEKAGWFVVEVLEAASIVLAEPWDPDKPAIDVKR